MSSTKSATVEQGPPAPDSIQIEQALLGAAILNPEAIQAVEGLVDTGDFSEPIHAQLWEIMRTIFQNGRLYDVRLLQVALGDATARIGEMTTGQYVARLAAEATSVVNARDYANLLRDLADQRRLASIGGALQREVKIEPLELATEAIERLDQIVARRTNVGTPALTMREAAVRGVDAIALAYQRDGALSGYTWGYRDLDNKTLGLHTGELTVVGGRPGMGKTALALGILKRAAGTGTISTMFSLEMGDVPLTHRMIADEMFDDGGRPVSYWLLRSGRIKEGDFARAADAAKRIALLPIRIEQRPALTVSQIAATARQEKRKRGLNLLVIDHLHLIKSSDRYRGNKVNEIGEITSSLKALAKELDVAVVALCQLSRGVEGRDDKRPNMGDLRASGDIEQDADTVVMLYREAYYLERNQPVPGSPEFQTWERKLAGCINTLTAIVEKQRNGPIGSIDLYAEISCNAVRDKGYVDRREAATAQSELRI